MEVCFVWGIVLVLCWLVYFFCVWGGCIMESKLVNEIMDVVNEIGVVIKKWEEIYCMVEVNKVFVYYCY